MQVRVTYITETKQFKNQDKTGKTCERSYESVEEAKAAAFPQGCVFAFIPVENGFHVYTVALGWEFYKKISGR